ncbi:MAG: hypothetical protein MUP21_07190, partial [Dehalococcoidia bacterium]|nr:hypothetical protein [Dehalococcoidia bacterium]
RAPIVLVSNSIYTIFGCQSTCHSPAEVLKESLSVWSAITKLELRVILFRGKREYTELVFYEMSYEKY